MIYVLFVLSISSLVVAQLSIPSLPYTPPDASNGSYTSNVTSVPNPEWSNLLGNLIYFYDEQRSGNLTSNNRVSWRNTSCMDDGKDAGLDLTGGYYDAGDYIKATYPLSFTLMSICWGAMEYGKGYDMTNQTIYLDSMLRWGLDWMIKAHPKNDTLYVLVGDTSLDGVYWGGDQHIPTPRRSYQINSTHPGTDAAAQASAAFSACSALYSGLSFNTTHSSPASLQNSTYASTLLAHSKDLYSLAVNASGGQTEYQNSVPEVADAYGSSTFGDELTIAALFLGLAANSSDYFSQAETLYKNNSLGGQDGVFNWDSKTPGIAVLFAEVSSSMPHLGGNLSQWQSEAERYFNNIINGASQASMTKGGLLWYDVSTESSLVPPTNLAMLLYLYSPLASSQDRSWSYTTFADKQLNYTLGANPMSCPYIVGSSINSPQNPHSALASGGDKIAELNTVPANEAYVLYGAMVGGPDGEDRFFDIRSDWPETEPALDINAPMLTLAALHAMNDTKDPFYTSLEAGAFAAIKPSGHPCDAAFSCAGVHSLSKGVTIAMAVIISFVGLATVLGLLYACFLGRRTTTKIG